MLLIKYESEPLAFAPNGAGERSFLMHSLRCSLRQPHGRFVDVARRVGHEQMHVSRLNRGRGNGPIGLADALADCIGDCVDHDGVQSRGRMLHAFHRHALPHGIALVKLVRFDVSDLLIPRGGPMAARIARQP